jgi:pimeloyl-ACP methyl ester carboxylesterase
MTCLTFVLVPGAGGSAWYWHRVVPLLKSQGHEAVAVELPAADDEAGLPEYAGTVIHAIGNRDPRRIVLVAQSLGGFTAPLVCDSLPIARLVLVNAMIPVPGETPGEWWANTGQAEARREKCRQDGRDPDAAFDVRSEFFHDVPESVVDAAWAQGEPRQSDAVFGSACGFQAWPSVPTQVVVGSDDRFFPAAFQRRVARDRLGISVEEMPGGHLLALSRPNELAHRLLDGQVD